MSSLLNLNNKTAAVIGASSGIGRAVALLLAEHGANVVLCARRADKLEETAALIRSRGGRAVAVAGDAALPETHEAVVRAAEREFGGLDIAVNNAGIISAYKPLADISPDEWRDTLDGNLTAAFLGARSQIPAMLARGGGSIVFTSSFVGTSCALPNKTAYGCAQSRTCCSGKRHHRRLCRPRYPRQCPASRRYGYGNDDYRPAAAGMGGRVACGQTHRPTRRNRRRDFVPRQPDGQFCNGYGVVCGRRKFGGEVIDRLKIKRFGSNLPKTPAAVQRRICPYCRS